MVNFFSTPLSVPVFQIVLLLLFSTIALLFGKMKLALLINYIFTLNWAYIFNRDSLMGMGLEKFDHYTLIYFVFGLGVAMFAAVGFLFQKN